LNEKNKREIYKFCKICWKFITLVEIRGICNMHHWLKGRDAPGLLVTKSAEMMHFGAIDASVTKPNIVRVGGCERLHKVV